MEREGRMIISIINHTNKADRDLQDGIRAVNRQIAEDFTPAWHIEASLKLEGSIEDVARRSMDSATMRGHAIIYLEDEFDPSDPLGFHNVNFQGIPFGVVFTDLAQELQEPWETTLSHEALEVIADPEVNRLVMGPHPEGQERDVFHWYEMCDAVQTETYLIDGIEVSNFVLPLYFTGGEEIGARNDFLGTAPPLPAKPLRSFGINPGGYVGFYDPATKNHEQTFADELARERAEIKSRYTVARRSQRYKNRRAVVTELERCREQARSKH